MLPGKYYQHVEGVLRSFREANWEVLQPSDPFSENKAAVSDGRMELLPDENTDLRA